MTTTARRVALAARRDGHRHRAAVTAAALDRLRKMRPALDGALTERDEVLVASVLTAAVLDATLVAVDRPIPHAHV